MKSPFHLAIGFLAASLCFAQTGAEKKPAPAKARSAKAHVVVSPDSLKWGPPPEGMVEGSLPAEFANEPPAQFAVVAGDPLKPGAPYILRIKTAPGSRIAPHWHPGDEHATVLKGTIGLGLGNKFDKAALHELSAGSYSLIPARTTHFGWSKDEAIVQVHGIGPFKVVWVSPAAARGPRPERGLAESSSSRRKRNSLLASPTGDPMRPRDATRPGRGWSAGRR